MAFHLGRGGKIKISCMYMSDLCTCKGEGAEVHVMPCKLACIHHFYRRKLLIILDEVENKMPIYLESRINFDTNYQEY